MTNDHQLKPKDRAQEISGEWEHDNQQWWNQYMDGADNEIALAPGSSAGETAEPEDIVALPNMADLQAELTTPYKLDPLAISQFNRDGYVKLKQVLSPSALALLRQEMEATLRADLGESPNLDFRSGEMMWLSNEIFRQFVLSPRIAEIAAALMRVQCVRLYHDNALAKEPGCGRTPWHYDAEHFPIASKNVCTAWIPLQAISQNMGPLGFAVGMDTCQLVESVHSSRFDKNYDRTVSDIFTTQGVKVDDGPFALGEMSFHHAQSFHTAGPNNTAKSRMVLATTYFEDGACVIPAPTMISGDWRKFMPGVGAGEPIRSRYNPVCFPQER
jgi:ectoine hydroxylase-related dioxygenase (phytanoyl-CoA dioxygenase family)